MWMQRNSDGKCFVVAVLSLAASLMGSMLEAQSLQAAAIEELENRVPVFLLRSVIVDSRELPLPESESLHLPVSPGTTTFTYDPNPLVPDVPLRFRCQLEGYEREWHERSSLMRMTIHFIDANGRDIGDKNFIAEGESPGWTGSFADSPWVHRREVFTVPEAAVGFWVVISSAGPPESVGAFAVRNLVVWSSQTDTNGVRLIPPVGPDASKSDVEARKLPLPGWGRSGVRPEDAILLRHGSGSDVALAILDDHPRGHADWGTAKVQGPKLTPGDEMILEWEEVYSIGAADYGRAEYKNIPAGLYRFRMEELTLMGLPTGRTSSPLVSVPTAAWKTIWFWIAVGLALFGVATVSWRLSAWQHMKRQVLNLERLRLLEQERFRIAQNIHDDLGARVAEIALVSSSAQQKTNLSHEARLEFETVTQLTNDLVRALYETVWAVNPKNDHLDSLANFVCQLANQMCAQASLRCRLEIPDLPEDIPVASPVRHHVIMCVKEAIHNVIKYGQASEIQIAIRHTGRVVILHVCDNGCGFDPAITVRGNGLDNMERRMQSLKGTCSIQSRPGAGTKVVLEFSLPND